MPLSVNEMQVIVEMLQQVDGLMRPMTVVAAGFICEGIGRNSYAYGK